MTYRYYFRVTPSIQFALLANAVHVHVTFKCLLISWHSYLWPKLLFPRPIPHQGVYLLHLRKLFQTQRNTELLGYDRHRNLNRLPWRLSLICDQDWSKRHLWTFLAARIVQIRLGEFRVRWRYITNIHWSSFGLSRKFKYQYTIWSSLTIWKGVLGTFSNAIKIPLVVNRSMNKPQSIN